MNTKIKIPKIYLLEKQTLVRNTFQWGMFIAYLGSLNPWFMWPIGGGYTLLAAMLLVASMLLSRTMDTPYYTRHAFLIPLLAYITLSYYLLVVNGNNFFAYVANIFSITIYITLFAVDKEELFRLSDFLAKLMGGMMLISIPFFLLHIIGFSLPSVSAQFRDGYYSFDNYFFFLVDDRFLSSIIPRFQAVFLEPGHLGTATSFLLFMQCGKWKRWYNILLLVATLISFSLSAYALLSISVLLHFWIMRKHFIGKLLMFIIFSACIVTASFFYNDGENMLHDLIVLRMEMDDDGELAGNNRVTDEFQAEYESYMQSSDIILGRNMDPDSFGNSGYKVFIYSNGLLGFFLLCVFYTLSMYGSPDSRVFISVMIVAGMAFWARGYLLWFSYFIPFYCMAMSSPYISSEEDVTDRKEILPEC